MDQLQEPWIFHRDELTLLEEGFEDLFSSHENNVNVILKDMEDFVLAEHLNSEKKQEEDLSKKIGLEFASDIVDESLSDIGQEDVGKGQEEFDQDSFEEHSVYRKSIVWSKEIVHWAEGVYFKEKRTLRDVYRVLVNAHLVPVKLSFACGEEMVGDMFSVDIALKEYDLARIYLERTENSLHALILSGVLPDEFISSYKQAKCLLKEVNNDIKRLRSQKPSLGII
jgi:hypothetical protein